MQSGFKPGLGGITLARAFEHPHLRFAPDRIELPARRLMGGDFRSKLLRDISWGCACVLPGSGFLPGPGGLLDTQHCSFDW